MARRRVRSKSKVVITITYKDVMDMAMDDGWEMSVKEAKELLAESEYGERGIRSLIDWPIREALFH